MIKDILTKSEKIKIITICNAIISNGNTHEKIISFIGLIIEVVYKIMPKYYRYYNLVQEYGILVDDILEMDSISDEEKQIEINKLLKIFEPDIIILAKDILILTHFP